MIRVLISLFFVAICFPNFALAVTLSLDPQEGEWGPGDTFVTTLRIDTASESECINAVDVFLTYPKEVIKVSSISKGESILTLWAEEPAFSQEQGTAHISGGIPGGYCGRVLGDPGRTNILAKIVFSIPGSQIGGEQRAGTTSVSVRIDPSSRVLFNDGAGSEAPLEVVNATYRRVPESRGGGNEWFNAVREDTYPPEEFSAQIIRDPNIHEGKYVLVWGTVDKQSGISHYEVMEEDPRIPGKIRGKRVNAPWVRTTSPYLLLDQELKSRITVRALDQAGNRREFVIAPQEEENGRALASSVTSETTIAFLGVMLFVIIMATMFLLRRRHHLEHTSEYSPSAKSEEKISL